jgi:dipeptidase D
MGQVLGHLEPKAVWDIFEEICQYPRPSKQEEKIIGYIENFAKTNGLELIKDAFGNLILKKPATPGMENKKGVVIQGHIDMVCEKNADVEFDFENDPIQTWIDGDWVKAKGTTLGADNGIGVAMGMALMVSKDVPHPALELLCTLDEETGLTGAINLGAGLLNAQILINLDSEEDGAFTIGCAGGINSIGTWEYKSETVPADSVAYEIAIKGLRGGHSGIEIHDYRGNGVKLLNRILWNFAKRYDLRVSSINGGNKHNAIPREAFAIVTLPKIHEEAFKLNISKCNDTIREEWLSKEPNVNLSASPKDLPNRIMAADLQKNILNAIYAMPHGQMRVSPDIPGLVQTSTNLAVVETKEDKFVMLTSQRSSVESEKNYIKHMVEAVITLAGGVCVANDGYPGWQPNVNSPILEVGKTVYRNLYGKEVHIEAIHAGLECGLVGEKYPGMDMISFGPSMKDVHSPDEKLLIPTVKNCWNLLVEMMKNIPDNN